MACDLYYRPDIYDCRRSLTAEALDLPYLTETVRDRRGVLAGHRGHRSARKKLLNYRRIPSLEEICIGRTSGRWRSASSVAATTGIHPCVDKRR